MPLLLTEMMCCVASSYLAYKVRTIKQLQAATDWTRRKLVSAGTHAQHNKHNTSTNAPITSPDATSFKLDTPAQKEKIPPSDVQRDAALGNLDHAQEATDVASLQPHNQMLRAK